MVSAGRRPASVSGGKISRSSITTTWIRPWSPPLGRFLIPSFECCPWWRRPPQLENQHYVSPKGNHWSLDSGMGVLNWLQLWRNRGIGFACHSTIFSFSFSTTLFMKKRHPRGITDLVMRKTGVDTMERQLDAVALSLFALL